jgi:hypothetical protein
MQGVKAVREQVALTESGTRPCESQCLSQRACARQTGRVLEGERARETDRRLERKSERARERESERGRRERKGEGERARERRVDHIYITRTTL